MPVQEGKDDQGYYFQWGDSGKKYYYKKNSKRSKEIARAKAARQGRAIKASQSRRQRGGFGDYYYEYLEYKKKYLNLRHLLFGGGNFKLTSPDFENGGMIGNEHIYDECGGNNIFPTLEWSNPPTNAKSYALVVDDPDAPAGTWIHLICWNIPASYRSLDDSKLYGVDEIIIGKNSWDHNKYGGPCPPSGEKKYTKIYKYFCIFASTVILNIYLINIYLNHISYIFI